MKGVFDLDVFLNPESVAVIGASEKPGSWGQFMMGSLRTWNYPGRIYPVNPKADTVYGIPAFSNVGEIKDPVDLAIIAVPEQSIEEVITACGKKGVKGVTIITAGFGEAVDGGKEREKGLASLAHSFGMRLIGPNVSGTFNLHAHFNAAASPAEHLLPTKLAGACQGGYAFYDLLASSFFRGMGVGKFIHTGNECDLTVTDFLEHFGRDNEVSGILMYLETIRDGDRFMKVIEKVAKIKPVVVYKAGRTEGSARAAHSHTGALSGKNEIFQAFFHQAGVVVSPTMELMVPVAHALVERPPMRGRRVGIVTVGGSWGVALSDMIEEKGLAVPELGREVQKKLRNLGMPLRASTKNPVDIGAAGFNFSIEGIVNIGREVLSSGEVDALILHGFGRPGMHSEDTPDEMRFYAEIEKQVIEGYGKLEDETEMPVLVGSNFSPWESQVIHDLNAKNFRIYNRLDDIAEILRLMSEYWKKRL
ncbi:MAG: CoA-binding protein [Deltaproteobacteria bacterium]|nr:CoA-binding protein [Deltaproteobacteria bacterium]